MKFEPGDHRAEVTPDDLVGDEILPTHPLYGIVWINPERMSGAPCFFGTRVPIKTLFDYVRGGDSIEEFLDGFPPITREHVDQVLERVADGLVPQVRWGRAA